MPSVCGVAISLYKFCASCGDVYKRQLHQFAEGKDEGVGLAEGTAYVQPGFHALADGFFHVFGGAVLGVEVFYGVTVGFCPKTNVFTEKISTISPVCPNKL